MIKMKGILQSREKMKRMIIPTISKIYCSPYEAVLMVRRRPNVVNGGGLAVIDSGQRVVFKVDGCVVVGKKKELTLRDGEGNALLLIKRKGTTMEALSMTRRWKGFAHNDLLGFHNLVFTLKEPNSCFSIRNSYEIRGDFQERCCSIINSRGDVIAQIGAIKEVEEVMRSRDLYNVRINSGIDQACIFGVIAVLDYIYDKST